MGNLLCCAKNESINVDNQTQPITDTNSLNHQPTTTYESFITTIPPSLIQIQVPGPLIVGNNSQDVFEPRDPSSVCKPTRGKRIIVNHPFFHVIDDDQ